MKIQLMQDRGTAYQPGRSFMAIFDKGDEFIEEMTKFSRARDISGANFQAIGSFSDAVLAYFDREKMDYIEIPVDEQVEVLTITGNISLTEEGYKIHAHAIIGKRDGTTKGGHILQAHVWPTLEVFVIESPQPLKRERDEETGLTLLVPQA